MISPDGRYISYLKPYKNRLNIFVQTLDGQDVTRLTADTTLNISYYFWANNDELLYLQNSSIDETPKLFAVNRNGSNSRKLIGIRKTKIRLIAPGKSFNNEILVALNKRDSSFFDAYKLNLSSGKLDLLAKNPGNITEWFADPQGKLRLAIASDGVDETLLYRHSEKSSFKSVLTNNFKTTVAPLGFSKDSFIYALSNQNRDKMALVEIDCNTGKERVIYSNPDVDVSEGAFSKYKNHLMFAGYETWKKERHYLEDRVKNMYQNLEKLLPNTEIKISDRDTSGTRFIIRTFTDRNPGTFYLYTNTDNKLQKLSDVNPAFTEEEMCEMKPVSFKTRDGITVNGYLTLPKGRSGKNLPIVVIPHGGPSARNSWGYNAEVQFLANRGYGVFQLNYRGSTGYGKTFWIAGFKQWGGKIQDDITDGVRWLINEGVADPKRIAIFGSSFGGFSALNGLCFHPELYRCGISYSGLTNLFTYVKAVPPYYKPYRQMYYEMVGNPETDADYFRNSSPVFHTDRIKVPVLIAQGTKDPRVNVNETNQFVKELKKRKIPVTYILKEDEGHFFKKQENRIEFYRQLEKFLEVNMQKN
ncbi:MAG TPA: S9 family peptidase [Daejeonella sp.]|nr:S9 family peptidase [Daejeonella sp.]